MKLAVIGSGYVGLVSGACFAEIGHTVVCVDKDKTKIEALEQGIVPIYEPGLDELISANRHAKRLTFTTDLAAAVSGADAIFIAVGTPSRAGDGLADLSYVHGAAREIARAMSDGAVVVTKSTVPVGTGDEVERILRAINPGVQAAVASNPEFLREGAAIGDFMKPDRVVVGADDAHARAVIKEIYAPIAAAGAPIVFTSRRTAELTKYAANAFLAVKLTFINEMADLCEAADADVAELACGMGLDSRIGAKFLNAGPGYGGSCFPKDTLALIRTAQDYGTPLRTVETIAAINDTRKRTIVRKIVALCGGSVRGKTVAVLGLTFKPDTDDMREAPSIAIIGALQDFGAQIRAYDPVGMEEAKRLMPGITYCADAYEAGKGADVAVIITEWTILRSLDLVALKAVMRSPRLADFRNVFERPEVEALGYVYECIGRPKVLSKASLDETVLEFI